MMGTENLTGIVICGGASSRMGRDKSQLIYHGKPQCYWMYEILAGICDNVVISCNKDQVKRFGNDYPIQPDLAQFENIGPMAGLLTAFATNPAQNLLVSGCDYPFLDHNAFNLFLQQTRRDSLAAVFYNREDKYEPLIGWYSYECAPLLQSFFEQKSYSLQHFLRSVNAEKYSPDDPIVMTSVDTPEQFQKVQSFLNNTNL